MSSILDFGTSALGVPGVTAVAEDLAAIEATRPIRWLLVGALARDIVLLLATGHRPLRATRDLDVAITVASWEEYEAVRQVFLSKDYQAGGPPHRLISPAGTILDLLPFGGLERPQGSVAWPPDGDVVMLTLGFEAAMEGALTVRLDEGPIARIASIPGLVVLKLIAWGSRGRVSSRDAEDLALLLRLYGDTDDALLYEVHVDLLDEPSFDGLEASARMLGRDAASLLSRYGNADTKERFSTLVQEQVSALPDESRLASAMRPALASTEQAERLLAAFATGVEERWIGR